MKKFSLSILVICFLLTLVACNPFEQTISGVWFYNPPEQRAKNDTLLTATSFIHLQDEGVYTRDFGRYEAGRWQQDGDELVLTNNTGRSQRIRIKELYKNELQLFANESQVASFQRYPTPSGEHNPFTLANNRWRVKATQSESETAIKSRLHNHCQFWETYFTWALNNSVDGLDVSSTPTPLKIYANGFGLKKWEDLPAAWKGYFYDTTDCRKADVMIKSIFKKRNIKWPDTDVTYEKFISAFQQLKAQLQ
jgi:hypothetical protein